MHSLDRPFRLCMTFCTDKHVIYIASGSAELVDRMQRVVGGEYRMSTSWKRGNKQRVAFPRTSVLPRLSVPHHIPDVVDVTADSRPVFAIFPQTQLVVLNKFIGCNSGQET